MVLPFDFLLEIHQNKFCIQWIVFYLKLLKNQKLCIIILSFKIIKKRKKIQSLLINIIKRYLKLIEALSLPIIYLIIFVCIYLISKFIKIIKKYFQKKLLYSAILFIIIFMQP